uniref:Uncharacterized protein n=1 Tax=biofilter metagenome TaxID=1070537 RepID=A0A193SD69_9ZZZZ
MRIPRPGAWAFLFGLVGLLRVFMATIAMKAITAKARATFSIVGCPSCFKSLQEFL